MARLNFKDFDCKLINKKQGKNCKLNVEDLDFIGIYFSAHWCPPCRGFTPKLVEYYNKVKDERKFEIIFVSSDQDRASFKRYFDKMPWMALKFGEQERKDSLSKTYRVQGIPYLVILDRDGKILTKDGGGLVAKNRDLLTLIR